VYIDQRFYLSDTDGPRYWYELVALLAEKISHPYKLVGNGAIIGFIPVSILWNFLGANSIVDLFELMFLLIISLYIIAFVRVSFLKLKLKEIRSSGMRSSKLSNDEAHYQSAVIRFEQEEPRRRQAYEQELANWEYKIKRWDNLYYCELHNIVFIRGESKFIEPDNGINSILELSW